MTDPTTDAAKLLPCANTDTQIYHTPPNSVHDDSIHVTKDGAIGINVAGSVIVKPLREWHALANTRPQPAPPAGEPDFEEIAGHLRQWIESPDNFYECRTWLAEELERMYRLGLAARPKVEDAALVLWKKQYGAVASDPTLSEDEARTLLTKAYDLLERLAADRDEWKQQHENLVRVRQVDVANLATKIDDLKQELDRRKGDPRTRLHNICEALQEDLDKSPYTREEWEEVDKQTVELQRKLREAEAKLAEREAELAQMQRERDGERETRERASDALMAKDEAIGVLIEIAGPQACQRAMDILDERRAARQQTTKEKT